MIFRSIKLLLLVLLLDTTFVSAKVFRNGYIAFELPPYWSCNLEQTEWVCISDNKEDRSQATIIFTAKEKGQQDSLENYQTLLKNSKMLANEVGKMAPSKVLRTVAIKINNHTWIDGWHQNSEIPDYYTRYLATVKEPLAIVVTFSAHKKFYTRYSFDFANAVQSLRVIGTGLIERQEIGLKDKNTLGQPLEHEAQPLFDEKNSAADLSETEIEKSIPIKRYVAIGVIVAVMIFIVWRSFRKP